LSKQIIKKQYNDGLIELFLAVSYKSSIAYLTAITLYIIMFFEYVPSNIFWTLIGAHFFYQVIRFYFLLKYKDKKLLDKEKQLFITQHTILMLFGGIAWGFSCYWAIYYSPSPYEYAMLFLVVSMSAGSISTLSAIYRIYLAFNIPLIMALCVAFLFKEGELNSYITLVLPIFTYVIISASHEVHKTLKNSMELKDLYAESRLELKEINMSLENRISTAVEENLKKDKQMLEQSRLAQMGEMLSMIAHQWRQPLSAITSTTGSISLHMQLDGCDEKYVEENINAINKYTQYLSSTITDFRNFFKPNKEKTKTNINEVVKSSLKIIESSLADQGISIKKEFNSKQKLYTYSNELMQVVLNILKNSKDVLGENSIENQIIYIKTYDMKDIVVIEVNDNAGGVKEENIKYIFDPYFTTKENLDGTGLGLYMSKLIVQEHCKGELLVENNENGALFSIKLPIEN